MTQDELVQLVELQGSCVQQLTNADGMKLNWEVFNKDGVKIFTLPKRLIETDIFAIQKFVREFEKKAFIAGENYATDLKDKEIKSIKDQYEQEMQRMRDENSRITTMLDKYMLEHIEDDDDPQSKIGIPKHML